MWPKDMGERVFPQPLVVTPRSSATESLERMAQMHTIVSEARCEVREPKPLRLSEMNRMTELCRDRVASLVGGIKEKRRSIISLF